MKLNTELKLRPPGLRQRAATLYLLSFILPFFVLTLACLALLVTPFGNHNLTISDGKFYINGLMFMGRLLKGQENLLYSFKNGLGGNEWSLLAWDGFGLSSLMSVFMTYENAPTLFTWICLSNLSMCGLTMYILLAHFRGHRLDNLLFSTAYAMSGYCVANCFQTGFFIGPQLLPLMALGLFLLVEGRSPLLYVLSLGACILLNFYFGFMLCIASVLLFAALLYLNQEELTGKLWRRCRVYMASSAIAGLLPAFFWLPTLKAYSGGDGRLNQTGLDEFRFSENMPFIQIFSKLFSGANSQNEEVAGLPNIYCGILVVALVVLFFLNKRIPVRRRRVVGLLLGFYLLTFYITAFTLVMHGGTHTNWFPYRYSYVFTFLLVGIAAEQFGFLKELTLTEVKNCGVILLLSAILVFSTQYEFVTGGSVVLDFALLGLMGLGFYLYKTKPKQAPRRTLVLFLLLLSCANLYANFALSIHKLRDWEKNLAEYQGYIMESGAIVEALNNAEDGFFRMEKDVSESASLGADPYLYGYNGVSHAGPGERMFVHKQLNRLGVNWFDMRHWYEHGVPAATDTLLGLKYLVSKEDLKAEKAYNSRLDANGTVIYENPNALSVAILTDNASKDVELGTDCFENLNHVWKTMTGGKQDIFTPETDITFTLHNATDPVSISSKELSESVRKSELSASGSTSKSEQSKEPNRERAYIEYSFTAAQDGPIYAFNRFIPVSEGGSTEKSIQCIGVYKKGETVQKHVETSVEYMNMNLFCDAASQLAIAYADNDVLADYAAQLNARDITFHMEHENQLNGSFTAEKGQRILFTLPWDEGWTCYIDGQKVPIDKTWDLFMSVEVPEGAHTWEMKFFPAWMDYGLYIGGAALVGLVVLMVFWKKKDTGAAKTGKNQEMNCVLQEAAQKPQMKEAEVPIQQREEDDDTQPDAGEAVESDTQPDTGEAVESDAQPDAGEAVKKEQTIFRGKVFLSSVRNNHVLNRTVTIRPSLFFVCVSLLGMLSVLLAFYCSRGSLMSHYFWYDSRDTGMDFFNSIEYLHGNRPYSIFGTLYPPLANVLFGFLYHFMPPEVTDQWGWNVYDDLMLRLSPYDPRTYQETMMPFLFFVILSVLLSVLVVNRIVEKKGRILKYGLILSSVCSYCMISSYERGNIVVLSFGLTVLFLITYDHKNAMIREAGMICLALAAGLKLYPAVYGLILLKEQRWKQAARTILYGILSVLLPTLCLGDGLSGLVPWISALTGERVFTYGTQSFDYSAGGILRGLVSLGGIQVSEGLISCASVVLWAVPLLCFFHSEERWKQLLYLTMALLLFASQGGYGLCFFLIPLLWLIRTADCFSKDNCIQTICMVLLVVHLPVFYEPGTGWFRMPFYHIIFIVLLVTSICECVRRIKEKQLPERE